MPNNSTSKSSKGSKPRSAHVAKIMRSAMKEQDFQHNWRLVWSGALADERSLTCNNGRYEARVTQPLVVTDDGIGIDLEDYKLRRMVGSVAGSTHKLFSDTHSDVDSEASGSTGSMIYKYPVGGTNVFTTFDVGNTGSVLTSTGEIPEYKSAPIGEYGLLITGVTLGTTIEGLGTSAGTMWSLGSTFTEFNKIDPAGASGALLRSVKEDAPTWLEAPGVGAYLTAYEDNTVRWEGTLSLTGDAVPAWDNTNETFGYIDSGSASTYQVLQKKADGTIDFDYVRFT